MEERQSNELLQVWKEWGRWQREVWLQAGNAEDGCLKEGLSWSIPMIHHHLKASCFLRSTVSELTGLGADLNVEEQ